MGFVSAVRAHLELRRLEKRHVHRDKKRVTIYSTAVYLDGEYQFSSALDSLADPSSSPVTSSPAPSPSPSPPMQHQREQRYDFERPQEERAAILDRLAKSKSFSSFPAQATPGWKVPSLRVMEVFGAKSDASVIQHRHSRAF